MDFGLTQAGVLLGLGLLALLFCWAAYWTIVDIIKGSLRVIRAALHTLGRPKVRKAILEFLEHGPDKSGSISRDRK